MSRKDTRTEITSGTRLVRQTQLLTDDEGKIKYDTQGNLLTKEVIHTHFLMFEIAILREIANSLYPDHYALIVLITFASESSLLNEKLVSLGSDETLQDLKKRKGNNTYRLFAVDTSKFRVPDAKRTIRARR